MALMAGLGRRFFRIESGVSVPQAFLDYLAGKWIEIAIAFIGGGGMSYLASITTWLKPWGPVIWFAIGIIFSIIIGLGISSIYLIKRVGDARKARALLDTTISRDRDKINPLDRQFSQLIISPNDLFIHYEPVLRAKQFRECHFVGPGVMVFLDRCEMTHNRMTACNYVVFNEENNYRINGALGFVSSMFENCQFINITFIMPSKMARVIIDAVEDKSQIPQFIGYEFAKDHLD